MKSYDSIPENADLLLDLPFREGFGTITKDHAKPHHPVSLVNTPAWATLASGLGVLTFDNSSNEYGEIAAADSVDLDFIAGNYSIGVWINWEDTMTTVTVVNRVMTNFNGWELYLFNSGAAKYLTLRHHHSATLVGGNPRTACNSVGWETGKWIFVGVSRFGAYPIMWRNGVPQTMAYSAGGLVNPETCGQDVVIGARYTKNADFYKGSMWGLRIWNRALSGKEWLRIFENERLLFGV